MKWFHKLNWPSIAISLVMAVAPAYASYVNALASFDTKIALVKADNESLKQKFSEFYQEYREDTKDLKEDVKKLLVKQGVVESRLHDQGRMP